MNNSGNDYINQNIELMDHVPFLLVLGIGSVFFPAAYLVTLCENNLWWRFDLTTAGVENWISHFKYHFHFLAAILSVLGIIALVFRSKQTMMQINVSVKQVAVSRQQNNFTNYYSHRKMFFEHLASIESEENITFFNKSKNYRDFFPDSSPQAGVQENSFIEPYVEDLVAALDTLEDGFNLEHSWDRLMIVSLGAAQSLEVVAAERTPDFLTFSELSSIFYTIGAEYPSVKPDDDSKVAVRMHIEKLIDFSYKLLSTVREIGEFHRGFDMDFRQQEASLREFGIKMLNHFGLIDGLYEFDFG